LSKQAGKFSPDHRPDPHLALRLFLFDESQACPAYELRLKAIENRRTQKNDEVEDAEGLPKEVSQGALTLVVESQVTVRV
jgi:hypothetical protein